MPELSSLGPHTPIIGAWDDHDFGSNDGKDSKIVKDNRDTRCNFVEYRAHAQLSNGSYGVYLKVDLGMMDGSCWVRDTSLKRSHRPPMIRNRSALVRISAIGCLRVCIVQKPRSKLFPSTPFGRTNRILKPTTCTRNCMNGASSFITSRRRRSPV